MTPTQIGLILGCFFLGDIIATYTFIRLFRKRYPKMDYKELELNGIIGWCWTKFGFEAGTLIAPLAVSPFWLVMISASVWRIEYFYMFLGMYLLLSVIHLSNFELLFGERRIILDKKYQRLYGDTQNSGIAYAIYKGGK
jgi:hypothetical protein